jgi:hypothetical protein
MDLILDVRPEILANKDIPVLLVSEAAAKLMQYRPTALPAKLLLILLN